jgi:hypothetical protein
MARARQGITETEGYLIADQNWRFATAIDTISAAEITTFNF